MITLQFGKAELQHNNMEEKNFDIEKTGQKEVQA